MPTVDIISSYVSISTPKLGSKTSGHENFKGDSVKASSPMTTEPLKNKNKNKKKNEWMKGTCYIEIWWLEGSLSLFLWVD